MKYFCKKTAAGSRGIALIVTLISGEVNFLDSITTKFSVGMCFFPLGTNLGHFFLPRALFGVFFQRVGGPSG